MNYSGAASPRMVPPGPERSAPASGRGPQRWEQLGLGLWMHLVGGRGMRHATSPSTGRCSASGRGAVAKHHLIALKGEEEGGAGGERQCTSWPRSCFFSFLFSAFVQRQLLSPTDDQWRFHRCPQCPVPPVRVGWGFAGVRPGTAPGRAPPSPATGTPGGFLVRPQGWE